MIFRLLGYCPHFLRGSTVLVGVGLLAEVSRLYSDKIYSVEFLWMSDRPAAETST